MSQRRGLGKGLGALIPSGGVKVATGAPGALSVGARDGQGIAPEVDAAEVVAEDVDLRDGSRTDSTLTRTESQPTTTSSLDQPQDESTASQFGLIYAELEIREIAMNPRQPRKVFDEDALQELTASIVEIGLLQPVVVRKAAEGFELVAGERRLRATQLAGMTVIPALIRDTEDESMLRDALLENLHRVQLNALEEAAAYSQLLQDFSCTQEELATRIGRSRPQISNTIRLLRLPPGVQRRVAAGVLSAGHARALLSLSDSDQIEALASRIVAEGLSVRAVEEIAVMQLASSEGSPPKAKKGGRKRQTPVEYREAADSLGDLLETRVRIETGSRTGRVVVEFGDIEDLGRILDLIRTGIED